MGLSSVCKTKRLSQVVDQELTQDGSQYNGWARAGDFVPQF